MQIKVSIIVPVYNVAQYLKRSMESLVNQTLKDIEIIIVNDGSTDNSLKICKEYAAQDDRIMLVDQKNMGVSEARNVGMQKATGEYIGFIDPDDWVELNMFEEMYYAAKNNNADATICEYLIEAGDKKEIKPFNMEAKTLQKNEILNLLVKNMIGAKHLFNQEGVIMGSVCRVLFKRSNLEKWSLKFNKNLALMEDLIFCVEYFIKANQIRIINKPFYHYVKNFQSAVTSYRKDKEKELKEVYEILMKILKDIGIENVVRNRMNIRYMRIYLLSITNESHVGNKKKLVKKIKAIHHYCRCINENNTLYKIDISDYHIKHKVLLFLIKNKLSLIIYTYYRLINIRKKKVLS